MTRYNNLSALRTWKELLQIHRPVSMHEYECCDQDNCFREHVTDFRRGLKFHGAFTCAKCGLEDSPDADYPEYPCDTVKKIREALGE